MGCSCRGGVGGATSQPAILGYNYQPPAVNGVLPPVMGPYSTILEARAEQRRHGGGSIKTIRK